MNLHFARFNRPLEIVGLVITESVGIDDERHLAAFTRFERDALKASEFLVRSYVQVELLDLE